jgi:transcriptional regulator with XRE-family HTH domain
MTSPVASLGERIRECRTAKDVTQEALAKHLDISRSAVAQWESSTTAPSIPTLVDLAQLLNTTPEYLAFGIKDNVRTVYRAPERSGMHTVDVIRYGDTPEDVSVTSTFAIDEQYAKDVAVSGSPATLRGFEVPASGLVDGFTRGDRVIIDVSATRPSTPGVYVYWNGFAVSIAQISAGPGEKGPVARITEAGQTMSIPLDQIQILGRVVAHWSRV